MSTIDMNQGVFQLQAQEMVIPYIKYVALPKETIYQFLTRSLEYLLLVSTGK